MDCFELVPVFYMHDRFNGQRNRKGYLEEAWSSCVRFIGPGRSIHRFIYWNVPDKDDEKEPKCL